jgi:hypothetical protein
MELSIRVKNNREANNTTPTPACENNRVNKNWDQAAPGGTVQERKVRDGQTECVQCCTFT